MPIYLVDFDSTLVGAETLDVLGEIALAGRSDRDARLEEIRALTDRAMEGGVGFGEALARRLALLDARREHLPPLIARLKIEITPSAWRNAAFLARPEVQVVSGGFAQVIAPVLAELGVTSERVHANRLLFDGEGRVSGVDTALPLSRDGGKIAVALALGAASELVMVGDGWTDYEVYAAGAAARFYAFTEVVARPRVLAHAERTAASFDDLLRQES